MEQLINNRIKEIEKLITILPIHKSFAMQSRLVEAKYILELIKQHTRETT